MKKLFAVLLAVMMVFISVAPVVSANFDIDLHGAQYTVIQPKSIELVPMLKDKDNDIATVFRNCTIDAMIDGDPVRGAKTHSTKGLILIQNSFVPANANLYNGIAAEQDPDLVPSFAFAMDFGSAKEFDTAYFMLYYEIGACVAIPDKKVIVEVSKDGKTWTSVGTDGKFYMSVDVDNYNQDYSPEAETVECAIYLGEKITSRYVRYTFTYMQVSEKSYWKDYTNFYEWVGFTEVGVAKHTGGSVVPPVVKKESELRVTVRGSGDVVVGDTLISGGDSKISVSLWLEDNVRVPVKITPAVGYKITGIKLDGRQKDSVSSLSINEPTTLEVTFEPDIVTLPKYQIVVSCATAGGVVSAGGYVSAAGGYVSAGGYTIISGNATTINVEAGQSLVISVYAAEGYQVEAFTVGGVAQNLTNGTYVLENVAANATVAVSFRRAVHEDHEASKETSREEPEVSAEESYEEVEVFEDVLSEDPEAYPETSCPTIGGIIEDIFSLLTKPSEETSDLSLEGIATDFFALFAKGGDSTFPILVAVLVAVNIIGSMVVLIIIEMKRNKNP